MWGSNLYGARLINSQILANLPSSFFSMKTVQIASFSKNWWYVCSWQHSCYKLYLRVFGWGNANSLSDSLLAVMEWRAALGEFQSRLLSRVCCWTCCGINLLSRHVNEMSFSHLCAELSSLKNPMKKAFKTSPKRGAFGSSAKSPFGSDDNDAFSSSNRSDMWAGLDAAEEEEIPWYKQISFGQVVSSLINLI